VPARGSALSTGAARTVGRDATSRPRATGAKPGRWLGVGKGQAADEEEGCDSGATTRRADLVPGAGTAAATASGTGTATATATASGTATGTD